jgi:ribosomal protein L11 methyltransferase
VRIDPGMAFGTGLHPTTRLCLAAMDERLPVRSVLDVGCGSGVLAIAAARAGAEEVVAIDNDPEAVAVARDNVHTNGADDRIRVLQAGQETTGRYPLVVANILSSTLIRLAPDLVERLEPGGQLLLSGLLASEVDEVLGVYRSTGCRLAGCASEGGWALLHLVGPGDPA